MAVEDILRATTTIKHAEDTSAYTVVRDKLVNFKAKPAAHLLNASFEQPEMLVDAEIIAAKAG